MHWQEMILRLMVALVLGALAGCDRERRGKPAGLKTFALVSLGAATFTLISVQLINDAVAAGGQGYNPLRLVAGIVGGIGFLGAGTIIHSGGDVEGVTTAAGIWIVGAIGVACGAGYYVIAAMAFGGVIIVWLPIGYAQHRWFSDAPEPQQDQSSDKRD